MVMDGTYTGAGNVNLNFYGKAVNVSAYWWDAQIGDVVIDCQSQTNSGFTITSGEGVDTIITGITIKNCYNSGVYVRNSAVKLVNCAFVSNVATSGGAVMVTDGYVVSDNTIFQSNQASDGGAFYVSKSNNASGILVTNAKFLSNIAQSGFGGAVSLGQFTSGRISASTFYNNDAPSGDGRDVFIGNSASVVLSSSNFSTLVSPTVTRYSTFCSTTSTPLSSFSGNSYCLNYNPNTYGICNPTVTGTAIASGPDSCGACPPGIIYPTCGPDCSCLSGGCQNCPPGDCSGVCWGTRVVPPIMDDSPECSCCKPHEIAVDEEDGVSYYYCNS